jgi:tyrosyl-tRNA synthetase
MAGRKPRIRQRLGPNEDRLIAAGTGNHLGSSRFERGVQFIDSFLNLNGATRLEKTYKSFQFRSVQYFRSDYGWRLESVHRLQSNFAVGCPVVQNVYTEFSYMLLQAYDFVYLHKQHGCELQIGGSDQWGNITAGIDLARRMHGSQLYGLTCPLLLKSDGQKMGKTEKGAVYLSAAKTSPYAFYQYWINVADADTAGSLRFLTELSHAEIETLDKSRAEQPHLRESQKRLAEELTRLIHGEAGLAAARKATEIFFGAEIENLTDAQLADIFADVPSVTLPRERLSNDGLPLADALVEAGLCKSKGEARRTIEQGGAYVNNCPETDVNARLTAADLASESVIVLRSGKKKYALVRVP